MAEQVQNTQKSLIWSIILTGGIFFLEAAGGWLTNSLALLADAGHVFMDVFALALSLAAIKLASIPADNRRTFGWHRAEVFAAFINGLVLVGMSFFIIKEAYGRLHQPQAVLPLPMMVVALIGLGINVAVARILAHHDHHDLNVKSAYFHVLGDMLSSVLVVLGGIIMSVSSFWLLDPLLSMVIAVFILTGAFKILQETVHILLEGTPRHIDVEKMNSDIKAIAGVCQVHDIHLWSVCSHIITLACHVQVNEEGQAQKDTVLKAIRQMVWEKYHVTHTIIEVESNACSLDLISQDLQHRHRQEH